MVKLVANKIAEGEVEVILQRLDPLTHDETSTTVASTQQVVYCLVSNIKVVIDSMQALYCQWLTRLVEQEGC